MRGAFTVLGAAGVAVGVAGLALHDLPMRWQPLVVAAAFARYLMAAAPVGAVLLVVAGRGRGAVLGAAVTVLALTTQVPLYVGGHAAAGAASTRGGAVTVLQANLRLGFGDAGALVRAVRRDHVDVLMTEELTVGLRDRLVAAGLRDELPYLLDSSRPAGGSGLAIWSRYPLSDTRRVDGFRLGLLTARVALPSGPATVVAVHVVAPYPYPARRWAEEIARLGDVLDDLAGAGLPVVVAGDLNSTPDLVQFRRLLTDGYRDAADQAGAGYLATYPADRWFPPLIAIDHVLLRDAVARSVRRVDLPGSDHRGLVAEIDVGR